MRRAAAAEEFERAARLRDDIQALERALEKQAVVLGDGTDCDVIALAEDQLEAAVQVFYVRGGRVRGQRGWVVDKVEDVTAGDLVEHFLSQVYGDDSVARNGAEREAGRGRRGDRADPLAPRGTVRAAREEGSVPREVLVPVLPPDRAAVEEWLAARRGGPVRLRVPQRGDKKALLGTVARNAGESLALHKTRRASDLTTRSRALNEIQEALGLAEAPLRIECYDVSNLQGTHVVASMVVFEDGLARKSEYRRFRVKGTGGEGDVAAVHEVISRRFRNYLEEREATGELDMFGDPRDPEQDAGAGPRQRKFAYPPNLAVIDGGQPQVAAAVRALAELGIDDVAVCGLAKRLEEVWLPDEDSPVIMPRTSEGLYLLQRVRDEAHRFAITYHRQKRSKALRASELDEVPGLGPARRTTLLRHFGSVRKIAAASEAEISGVHGIGPRLAAAVVTALHGGESGGPDAAPTESGSPESAQTRSAHAGDEQRNGSRTG
jgi:excinuclease ABC subunit C